MHAAEAAFVAIEKSLRGDPQANPPSSEVIRQLKVSDRLAFKIWALIPALQWAAWTLLVFLITAGCIALWRNWDQPLLPERTVGWLAKWILPGALLFILGFIVNKTVAHYAQLIRYRDVLRRIAIGVGLG